MATNISKEESTIVSEMKEDDLLRKLEEQNRLLELDSRYTQKIERTESNASIREHHEQILSTTPTDSVIMETLPTSSEINSSSIPTLPTSSNLPIPTTSTLPHPVPTITTSETSEEELLSVWSNLLKNWEENMKKNSKNVRNLVRRGIPDPLRGMVWQLLAGPHDEELKKKYPLLIIESCPFEKQIKRDLDRTFPEHSFFKDRDGLGQESLLSVMKAYSLYDREVGYCQGSLFIAGLLLMHMPEEETFCVFVHLMNHYKLRELYKPTMADLGLRFYQLENLVEEFFPKLDIHFKALGFQTSMYSSSWFLTMFTSTLPLCISFRIMDTFLTDGVEVIFRIGLALLEHSYDQLMQLDLEDMTKHFQKEMKVIHENDPDSLFEKAFKIKLSSKRLKKLEKEFLQKKEKQANENIELVRLHDENNELEKRVMALEKECAALADRLIQGQVTRAQEAEEMFAVRRELSRLRKKVAAMEEKETLHGTGTWSPMTNPDTTVPSSQLISERDRSISAPSLQDLTISTYSHSSPSPNLPSSTTAEHVSREDAELVLKNLEISPTFSPSPNPHISPDFGNILQQLATVKIEHAEAMQDIEIRNMEIRRSRHREEKLLLELEEAKSIIQSLQHKLQEEECDTLSYCPHCGKSLSTSHTSLGTNSSSHTEVERRNSHDGEDQQYSNFITSLKSVFNSTSSSPDSSQISNYVNSNGLTDT